MVLDPCPGWGLRSVDLADLAFFKRFFTSIPEPLSDYSFSQVFTWRNSLRILWRELHGHLCIFANGTGDLTLLLPPLGGDDSGDVNGALSAAFELMDDYNRQHNVPDRSRVEYVSDALLSRLSRSRLDVQPMGQDYLYPVERMIDLAGGDLASKRQARNRFTRLYQHRVEDYDASRHLESCLALLSSWKQHQDAQHSHVSLNAIKREKESLATELTLRHAHELGLVGMVVSVTGPDGTESIRGFTFGEALGTDQSSIVVEKTDLEIKGLAQFIFAEFCRRHWSDRPFVNAGDDWGIESLAWTKMSYRPLKLLQKYVVRQTKIASVLGGAGQASPQIEMKPEPRAAMVPHAVEPMSSEVTIRPATPQDIDPAAALEQVSFDTYCLSKRQLIALQRNPNAVFRVAERDGEIIGEGVALVRHHKTRPSGRIYSLAVRSDARGQKIGHRLLTALIADLAARGVRRIFLEVEATNTGAIGLYERHGFRAIGTLADYYGPGRKGLHMLCELPMEVTLFPSAA